jgi:hypothetical protein
MKRRALLSAAATAGLAGCLTGYRGEPADGGSGTGSSGGGADGVAAVFGERAPGNAGMVARSGIPADVCAEPPQRTDILAIDEPAFADDWSDIETTDVYLPDNDRQGLPDDAVVVGLTAGEGADERARAYPLTVLWLHEIVNDVFEPRSKARRTESDGGFGGPVLVTYCPLCRSGVVATRRVAGEATTFHVTGLLWKPPGAYGEANKQDGDVFGVDSAGETEAARNGNLVMMDEATGSYWSQFIARAICGTEQGATLDIRPSTVETWGEWRREHPGTDVLLPPPHSGTVDYGLDDGPQGGDG